ncbi:response regulator [Pseudomonas sp. S9]|uniref:response regulator n=1 Tax=Pseudomonas sp. S9 TaxID=686578 RepID=UPI0002557102|nr:response regulator [Pseudomonas sp. S9]
MTKPASNSEQSFRQLVRRNIALPLGIGLVTALFFIGLIFFLINAQKGVENTDQVISSASQSIKLTIDLETSLRGYLITGEESFLQPYEEARPLIKTELENLKAMVKDNPDQNARLRRIQALHQEWDNYAKGMINLRRENADISDAVASGRGKRITDSTRDEYDNFIQIEQQRRQARNQKANDSVVLYVLLYVLGSLTLSCLLAYFGRRDLLGLAAQHTQILEQQRQSTELIEQKAWLSNGQSLLAEQVLGLANLQALGRNVLNCLASYLDVAVGAFYVRSEQGDISRIASYGFSRELENATQDFNSNESLVGQTASENKFLQLDNLPNGYLKVSSGLGSTSPVSIALLPISNGYSVNGVLELGFLKPIDPRVSEFLQLIAEPVGTSIDSVRNRQRLQEMLSETQQLNEELQVQQEELRTANEELEEQSRVLKESQAHLETQQAELEQTNEQLAEQTQTLADQRDALDERNTALGRVQVLLEERAQELQRASLYKSEFLANMSHELRTPLNSSLILAKLLADNPQGNLSDEQIKFAESIYSAGNDLLNLINDILDISKVEAGKLEVHLHELKIERVIESMRNVFEPLANEKNLEFDIQLLAGVPDEMVSDQQRIEQILKNLLSNAIKFTEKGRVVLTVSRQPGAGIAFAVQDTGIGIRQEQQESIFEAFRQADGAINRRYGGTGLGLSISRDLAALLGGSISITSEPGAGSTFTLLLPETYDEAAAANSGPNLEAAVQQPITVAQASVPVPAVTAPIKLPSFADDRDQLPAAGRCVLVIEDEPKFAQILYDLAHELEYNCLVAHGADEGVELASTMLPRGILLDMRLPDASGLTVLQRLKNNPLTRHIPVHVISVEDRMEAALQLGAIGYAVKPTTREHLKDVFAKLEAKLSQQVKRVLLVEDDALQRESIAHLIGDEDIEITAVEFGEQALELLRTTIFDCMIIDLKLPDMQGNQLLKRMSNEKICAFPPVIVYTGRNLTRDEEADLMKYSKSIIIKGARSPERLLDEVTLFLHKVESQLSTERQSMLKTARSRDKVFEGRRILLVDDDVRNIFALTSALEQKGAVVEVGCNGREAIEKLNQFDDIDLVLMDIMMPEMDGYEATEIIRQDPRWRKLPIIAVTAKAMKDDQDRCLRAGANDYLAKPIDLDRLFSLIRVWMPKLERI